MKVDSPTFPMYCTICQYMHFSAYESFLKFMVIILEQLGEEKFVSLLPPQYWTVINQSISFHCLRKVESNLPVEERIDETDEHLHMAKARFLLLQGPPLSQCAQAQ